MYAIQVKEQFAELKVFPFRCKRWDCPTCRPKKAKKYAERTFRIFSNAQKVRLLTVTFDRSLSCEDTWRNAADCWNRFRTAFVKKFGKTKFVRVVEPQKDGYPHYHILLDKYVPANWLKHELFTAGFGKIVDVRMVTDKEAFYYVLKYLKKQWRETQADDILKNVTIRRYNSSRDDLPKTDKEKIYRALFFVNNENLNAQAALLIYEILRRKGGVYLGRYGTRDNESDSYHYVLSGNMVSLQGSSFEMVDCLQLREYIFNQFRQAYPQAFKHGCGFFNFDSITDVYCV